MTDFYLTKERAKRKPRALQPLSLRFWKKVQKNEECWLWTGGKNKKGYGVIQQEGCRKLMLATHASFALHFQAVPKGMNVLHRCDNPSCVNPDHLFLGTQLDNMKDMWSKGRAKVRGTTGEFGSKNRSHKLTESQVLDIRDKNKQGQSTAALGEAYGISRQMVRLIVNRTFWQHI